MLWTRPSRRRPTEKQQRTEANRLGGWEKVKVVITKTDLDLMVGVREL